MKAYRAYRDWWHALELRQPGRASLMQVAAIMLGVIIGVLVFAPSTSLAGSLLAGAAVGATIAASWQYHRRRKAAGTGQGP